MKKSGNRIKVKKGELIIEGKTKKVFETIPISTKVIIRFKPDITAKDGEERKVIAGKDRIDCITNDNFFRLLNVRKFSTHYIRKLSKEEFLAKKLIRKIPVEVVTRRIGAGSIVDRTDYKVGHHFRDLYTEFFYKDDFLNDPRLDDKFIEVKDKKGLFRAMRQISEQAFIVVEEILRKIGYQLIDWKLEFGIVMKRLASDREDGLVIIDEITAGNIRIWPIKVQELDISQDNLLNQLDPSGNLDKQLFRDGKSLKTVKNAFEALAKLTSRFPEFYLKK